MSRWKHDKVAQKKVVPLCKNLGPPNKGTTNR